jgi:flagellar hook assembly protein FlgD
MLVPAPGETITWNGKNDAGEAVAPGTYLAQIQAAATPTSHLLNYAVGRVVVTA